MIGKGATLPAWSASRTRPQQGSGGIEPAELAELRQAVLHLRRHFARPRADPAGTELSLTAHFLNLAPSTTVRFRLWMGLCTQAATELLGDPLAHLRPVDTLDSAMVVQLLDRVADRLGLSSHVC